MANDPSQTTEAAAKMQAALASYPDLQDFGFGAYDSRKKTNQQIAMEIETGRKAMFEERSLEQFETMCGWLRQFTKIKTMNRTGTSYGLKHVAARSVGYCTNGVFIAAAIAEGFRVQPTDQGSPNALINISTKAWR